MLHPSASPPRGGEDRHQQHDRHEGQRRAETDFNAGPQHEPRQRDHDQAGDQRLQYSGYDLLDRDPADRIGASSRSSISRVN